MIAGTNMEIVDLDDAARPAKAEANGQERTSQQCLQMPGSHQQRCARQARKHMPSRIPPAEVAMSEHLLGTADTARSQLIPADEAQASGMHTHVQSQS